MQTCVAGDLEPCDCTSELEVRGTGSLRNTGPQPLHDVPLLVLYLVSRVSPPPPDTSRQNEVGGR
jgi:hypothetical protein